MTNPTNEHREQARAIRFPFPCGCMDAHEGGSMTVEEYTCAAHRLIAEALSSRDTEVREVLESLGVELPNGWCWCPGMEWSVRNYTHTNACKLTQALYAKLQPGKEGEDVAVEKD